ncbi:MAG: ABC transporter substrate-binding protein [Actinomycetia bacterium]|nr:ABC transporter substrate-binding protein [Actinomycetes bacterium]
MRILALLLALAMIAAACSSGDSDDDSGGDDDSEGTTQTTAGDISTATTAAAPDETGLEITRGGEISIGLVSESTGWYPPSAETAFSAGFLVMDALYDRWYDQSGSGDLIPMVAAERATPNEDASEWTMKIRPGILFHDGTEVNAAAAVDMIAQWHEGPFGSSSTIASAEAIDEFTVHYVLKDPNPAFEEVMAGISAGAVFSPTAGRGFGPEDSVENPVGTGPFMFESWTRDSEVVLTRNPNYWRSAPDGGTLPYLDRIRFRVLPDSVARNASLEAGDLDITTQGGPDGGQDLIDQGFVPYEFIGNGAGLNVLNTAVPPFDDVRIRRATAHALDPDQASALRPPNLSGVAEFRTQYFSSTSKWYDEVAGEPYARFDLAEAQRLYEEYTNDVARSDGKAAGEPISFIYDCNTDPINSDTALLYQQQWQDIGFEVELRFSEQASFVNQVLGTSSDPLFQGDFQAACWADGNDQDPLQLFRTRYVDGQVLNWTNFAGPELDAQIDILRTSLDFESRKAAASEITRITAEQMPVYWWASGSTLVMTQPNIRGVETYTYPDGEVGERRGLGRVWWHEVWLDGAEPLDDIATDFIDAPEPPATTTTTTTEAPAEPVAGGPNPDVQAAMPDPPGILTVASTDQPLGVLCPGITTLEGIEAISATTQNYAGDPQLGPRAAVTIYELGEGDADIILGRYDQALNECTEYSAELADGTALELGYAARDLGSFGPESYTYGLAGTAGGFPIDTDIVLIRSGNNLALVTALHILSPADGSVVTPLAESAAEILAGLG